jgi:hypothetical protein
VATLPSVRASLEAARQVQAQDVEQTDARAATSRQAVALERRISVETPEMRPGRKSRRQGIDGHKQHAVRGIDASLVGTVGGNPGPCAGSRGDRGLSSGTRGARSAADRPEPIRPPAAVIWCPAGTSPPSYSCCGGAQSPKASGICAKRWARAEVDQNTFRVCSAFGICMETLLGSQARSLMNGQKSRNCWYVPN